MQKKPELTAKIYQFPIERVLRRSSGSSGMPAAPSPAAAPRADIVYGSAWYHDAAIKDRDPTRR